MNQVFNQVGWQPASFAGDHGVRVPLALRVTDWCPESDSNQRPTAYEAVALPLSYRGNAIGQQPTWHSYSCLSFLARYHRAAKPLCSVKRRSTWLLQITPCQEHEKLER